MKGKESGVSTGYEREVRDGITTYRFGTGLETHFKVSVKKVLKRPRMFVYTIEGGHLSTVHNNKIKMIKIP